MAKPRVLSLTPALVALCEREVADPGPDPRFAKSAMLKGPSCTLLSVGADTPGNRSRLEAPAKLLRDAGYQVEALLLPGDPDEVIGARVESGDESLLVTGAYGHSRIRSLVVGSTTSATVRRCKIPVLLIR